MTSTNPKTEEPQKTFDTIVKSASQDKEFKPLDIFQHLKQSILNMDLNCTCEETERKIVYCIPCKITVCQKCNLELHKTHLLIDKSSCKLNEKNLEESIAPIRELYKNNLLFSDSEKAENELSSIVNKMCDEMKENIEKMRTEKLNDIKEIFNELKKSSQKLKDNLSLMESSLIKFINDNESFFNTKNSSEENKDETNVIFLINYDFLMITNQKSKDVVELSNQLVQDYEKYKNDLSNESKDLLALLNEILFDKYEKDKQSKDQIVKQFQKGKNEKIFVENRETYPDLNFRYNSQKLGNDIFSPIYSRIQQYTNQIEAVKQNIYSTMKTQKNLKNIEKYVNICESSKNSAKTLFAERKGKNKFQENKPDLSNTYKMTNIQTKEDVKLNHPLVQKYFAYMILHTYEHNYKKERKELLKSNIELKIKDRNEEDEGNIAKANEGTNEILFYDRKKCKMIKKQLNLTKNPFGYTKFPIGCRSLLVGSKLYISGGRDSIKTYPIVLIYDLKSHHIQRISDMRTPRCYHTMVAIDVFDTIIVLGGENCDTVEVFDPLTRRWQYLPELNEARANINFYFDQPRGYLYSMFGNYGRYIDNNYSDAIEFLDLTKVKEGWNFLDVKKNPEITLKSHVFVYPIPRLDKLLIYGGVTRRDNKKDVCVFDLKKDEIIKVDKKLYDELWEAAKNNKKLQNIVSTIKLKSH